MNRRDFLKITALTTMSFLPLLSQKSLANQLPHNIILIVLDSLSAKNMSLYGYPRKTTPYLEKFSRKATVYHRHYTPGTFTSPGTASLLTGTLPSTHRVTKMMGQLPKNFSSKNFFNILSPTLFTASYTQNLLAEIILQQFQNTVDLYTPIYETAEIYQQLSAYLFNKDLPTAYWGERISRGDYSNFRGSLYFSGLIDVLQELLIKQKEHTHIQTYPDGLPHNYQGMAYLPQKTFSWLEDHIQKIPTPFLSYYHLYPPHHPYTASKDFRGIFKDRLKEYSKPISIFGQQQTDLDELRLKYDEFIAETDYLLGTTLNNLEKSNLLDKSYVIITSDHGELFERGIWGHLNPTVYEPLIQIPLIIREPNQTTRKDVRLPTSSIDLLPTLCKISNEPIPEWAEGEILPEFSNANPNPDRSIYCMDFKENEPLSKYNSGTLALIQNNFKLIYYFGYDKVDDAFEFYDLEADPDELEDLYPTQTSLIIRMETELLGKLDQINRKISK